MTDHEPTGARPANVTLSDLTEDERNNLTDAQREALSRADRGELPVDARSPLYDEPASANFVHSIDPDAEAKGGPTDTTPDELLTSQTGEHGLVTTYHGDIAVDERLLGAGTEPGGEFSSRYGQPDGSNPPREGEQSDGSPTGGPAAPVEAEGVMASVLDDMGPEPTLESDNGEDDESV